VAKTTAAQVTYAQRGMMAAQLEAATAPGETEVPCPDAPAPGNAQLDTTPPAEVRPEEPSPEPPAAEEEGDSVQSEAQDSGEDQEETEPEHRESQTRRAHRPATASPYRMPR
jgi:hypothetical protein